MMDFGGVDRRKTKGDLKKKRLARGYKRGGKFRASGVIESCEEKIHDERIVEKKRLKKKKNKKR